MYEGGPMHPQPDRFWEMIDRHKVTVFYTAPTAIRAFMRMGERWPARHSLKTLRLLGSVGEPINPEAWMWYRSMIGHDRCPIVDTWWQTETGAIMVSPIPGATPTKPGSCTRPLPGISLEVVTREGENVPLGSGGYLVIRKPWPSMLRTIYGDDERYFQQYWSQIPGSYFTGDGARQDEDGYFWVMGRVDDVINVSGHRLSTMEVESALVAHPLVAEAAVVGRPDEIKGQGIVAFVTLQMGNESTPNWLTSCAHGLVRRSDRSRNQTTSDSPMRCPKRAVEKSCAACSANWPPAVRSKAIPQRSKTSECLPSCVRTKNDVRQAGRAAIAAPVPVTRPNAAVAACPSALTRPRSNNCAGSADRA